MANQRVLKTINNNEYIWSFNKANSILTTYIEKQPCKISKEKIYSELAPMCFVSSEGIKKWFSYKNGPSDYLQVEAIAKYFEVDPYYFLQRKAYVTKEEKSNTLLTSVNLLTDEFLYLIPIALKFRAMLNLLSQKSLGDYIGFSNYFNESSEEKNIVYDDSIGVNYGRVILDMCVDEEHHDIISSYDDLIDGIDYRVRVFEDEIDDSGYYITVTTQDGLCIVIENGEWFL